MNSARQHTDGTHSEATPTESMVTLPPHDACDPRLDDTVRIVLPGPLAEPVPRVLPACDDCGDRDDIEKCYVAGVAKNPATGRMQCVDCYARWIDADMATWIPRVDHNGNSSPKGVAFMSPEILREKLRACYPHYCRSIGCENVVDHCGDNCPRCTSEIDALLLLYAEQQDPRITWSTVLISCGIGAAVFGVVTLVLKWAGVL